MPSPQNVAIVGAGIVGLAHAWSAAERGHRVTVFERGPQASGASVRNFGMIWPIGQPSGEPHKLALASRQRWLKLQSAAGIWLNPCGSIHLAHRLDEWAVLEEFYAGARDCDFECSLLTATEVLARSPSANPDGLLGGLYSSSELCVNPRRVLGKFASWLKERFQVAFHYSTPVTCVRDPNSGSNGITLTTSRGNFGPFDRAVICSGSDLQTLYPEAFAHSGLKLCKLQMLKTNRQPSGWQLGPHLASGLTLRHYRNFEICPSLPALKERIAAESPDLDRFGIHVMASQNDDGEVILGDSHEYDGDIEPFDKAVIDDLMLRELRKVIDLPDWTIAERWHGVYAKHPTLPALECDVSPTVSICTGTGGAGMTMSHGLADRAWHRWS